MTVVSNVAPVSTFTIACDSVRINGAMVQTPPIAQHVAAHSDPASVSMVGSMIAINADDVVAILRNTCVRTKL